MTDVVLIAPPNEEFKASKPAMPPLGLASIASVIRQNGYKVKIVDCAGERFTFKDLRVKLTALNPRIVGVTGTSWNRFDSFRAIRTAKESCPNATVVYGGIHATFTIDDSLANVPQIDVIVRGEGEMTFLELVDTLLKGRQNSLEKVLGIAYRDGDSIKHNPPRPFVEDLDSLPYPARDLLPMDKYNFKMPFLNVSGTNMMTSMGCPMLCTFCSTSVMWGRKYRYKSPESVCNEIDSLIKQYNLKGIWFFDDTMNLNRKHFDKLLDLFIERGYSKLPWYCAVRVDTLDYQLLSKMKKAGCYYISFGVESGSQDSLIQVKKGIKLEHVWNVSQWAKDLDIYTKAFFILGLPGESLSDAYKTVELIQELKGIITIAAVAAGTSILPGTVVERQAYEQNILDAQFSWSKFEFSIDNLTIGRDPYLPTYIQPNLGFSELRKLKYDAIGDRLVTLSRVIKKLLNTKSLVDIKEYRIEAVEILKWYLRKMFRK